MAIPPKLMPGAVQGSTSKRLNIELAVDDLLDAVSRLEDAFGALRCQVEPILSPSAPENGVSTDRAVGNSTLAELIMSLADRVDFKAKSIRDIVDRL